MTTIEIDLRVPAVDGTDLPAVGETVWTPTRRRHIDESDDYIVLPVGFVLSVDGPTQVEVDPTASNWAWMVQERVEGGITRFVQVPASGLVLDYADLIDVDPATLDPAAEPEAAWWLAEQALDGRVTALEEGGTGGGLTKAEADGYYAPLAFVQDVDDTFADVATALNGKANTFHTHTFEQVPGLQAALDDKATDADLAGTNTNVSTLQGNYTTLAGNMDNLGTRVGVLEGRVATKITVAATAPTSPALNDVWIDTSVAL